MFNILNNSFIHESSILLIQYRVKGSLQPIPGNFGHKTGYTLDLVLVHCIAPVNLISMSVKTCKAGIKPTTLEMRGHSAHHYTKYNHAILSMYMFK